MLFDSARLLPGISLYQPWAGLVRLAGLGYRGKILETRPRRTSRRGAFVVCAGLASKHVDGLRDRLLELGVPPDVYDDATSIRGKAVAVAKVAGCRPLEPADEPAAYFYEPGRSAWALEEIWALQPFQVRGAQGWFGVERHLVIRETLAAVAGPLLDQEERFAPSCPGNGAGLGCENVQPCVDHGGPLARAERARLNAARRKHVDQVLDILDALEADLRSA